jgi:ATP-dependent DNA helicase RecG
MIDTIGSGIHQMHSQQVKRYLPLPDYDLRDPLSTRLTIHGAVVDPAYTHVLMERTDLSLVDVLALDRVQKGLFIANDVAKRLRKIGLIEGRKPNLHVAALVANATGMKVDYIRKRAQDDAHYTRLVLDYLDKFGSATRNDVDKLLRDKLSEALSEPQKNNKISNLLTKMKRNNLIRNAGSRAQPSWKRAE